MKIIDINQKFNLKAFLLFVFVLLIVGRQMCTIPNALNNINLVNNSIDLQRVFSTFILIFCSIILLFFGRVNIKKRQFIYLIFFLLVLILSFFKGVYEFWQEKISIIYPIIMLSRVLTITFIALTIRILTNSFSQNMFFLNIVFTVLIVVIIGFSLIQIFTNSYQIIQGEERLGGPFIHPNQLGATLNILIVFYLFFNTYYNKLKRHHYIILLILIALLFKSSSITSILTFIFFLLLMFIYKRWYAKKVFLMISPFMLFLIPLALYVFYEKIKWRATETLLFLNSYKWGEGFSIKNGSSLYWRIENWKHYIDLIDNPFELLFGNGLGSNRFLLLFNEKLESVYQSPGTHNEYLAVFIDFGLIGLLLMIILYRWLLKNIRHRERYNDSYGYVYFFLIAFLLSMTMDNYLDGAFGQLLVVFLSLILSKKASYNDDKNIR